MTFYPPDCEAFPCLRLAMDAAAEGGTATAILNGANEVAVDAFLKQKLSFLGIYEQVKGAMERVTVKQAPALEDILEADAAARRAVTEAVFG